MGAITAMNPVDVIWCRNQQNAKVSCRARLGLYFKRHNDSVVYCYKEKQKSELQGIHQPRATLLQYDSAFTDLCLELCHKIFKLLASLVGEGVDTTPF